MTQLVHAITVPLPDDHNHDLLVAAVASCTTCNCFLCAKEHLLLSCPLLSDIQKDPFHHRTLLRALDQAHSSPTSSDGPKQVRTMLDASLSDPSPAAGLSDDVALTSDF